MIQGLDTGEMQRNDLERVYEMDLRIEMRRAWVDSDRVFDEDSCESRVLAIPISSIKQPSLYVPAAPR